mmetsp:Transcript_38711/g.115675  ORF Transcript_38711/g.115675 Transcript_38711/m.115675 type:complete len:81 (-) Transcript_38711:1889-2131(-)
MHCQPLSSAPQTPPSVWRSRPNHQEVQDNQLGKFFAELVNGIGPYSRCLQLCAASSCRKQLLGKWANRTVWTAVGNRTLQ